MIKSECKNGVRIWVSKRKLRIFTKNRDREFQLMPEAGCGNELPLIGCHYYEHGEGTGPQYISRAFLDNWRTIRSTIKIVKEHAEWDFSKFDESLLEKLSECFVR